MTRPVMTPVLASQSPARLATLRGPRASSRSSSCPASTRTSSAPLPPAELALQLAELKCAAVAARDDLPDGALVLGCDSVLELDGAALGKPADAAEATRRWEPMRGRSGVLLHRPLPARHRDRARRLGTAATTVHFADVTDEEIATYVASGEPLHVAGAFTLDGLGGAFVTGIEGDHAQRGRRQPAAAPRAGRRAGPVVDRPLE